MPRLPDTAEERIAQLKEQNAGLRALVNAARKGHLCRACGEPIVDDMLPCPECDCLDPLRDLEEE